MCIPVVLLESGRDGERLIDATVVATRVFPALKRRAEHGNIVGEITQPTINLSVPEHLRVRGEEFKRYTTVDSSRVGFQVTDVRLQELADGEVRVIGNVEPTGPQGTIYSSNRQHLDIVPRGIWHDDDDGLALSDVVTFDAVVRDM